MARPQKQIDYKVLDGLCAIQCTIYECASILDMDTDTLNAALKRDGNECFSAYYQLKSQHGKASLRRRQYETAKDGNPTMLIWLGKQWLGQRDNRDTVVTQVDVESDQYEEMMAKATKGCFDE